MCIFFPITATKNHATICPPQKHREICPLVCCPGFGHSLAKCLHEKGCHVIATVLLPDGKGAQDLRDVTSPRMTVLPLDVSSDDSVRDCLQVVKRMCKDSGVYFGFFFLASQSKLMS